MAQALEMFFDAKAESDVRRLWARIDAAGVPSLAGQTHGRHRPHVTLGIAESLDSVNREALCAVLGEGPTRLDLHALGAFPGSEGVVFLSATVDMALLAQHRRVSEVLAQGWVGPWHHYLPGGWVPHCTLTQRLDHAQVLLALGAVLGYEPISAEVASVGITDTTTGEVELVFAR